MLKVDKVFVIHTKTGLAYRRKYMEKLLAEHEIEFEFMLDGDVDDLTPEILAHYFTENMRRYTARISCALKHIYVYERVLATPYKNVLILEDDAILHPSFSSIFNQLITELENRSDLNPDLVYVCLENSTLEFVAAKDQRPGQLLYRRYKTRGGGGYFLTYAVAEKIMAYLNQHKCHITNDLLLNQLLPQLDIPTFWCQPPLIEQASNNGMWKSSLGNQSQGFWRQLRWNCHKFINTQIRYRFWG